MEAQVAEKFLERGILGAVALILLGFVVYLFKENRTLVKEQKEELKQLYEMMRVNSDNHAKHMEDVARSAGGHLERTQTMFDTLAKALAKRSSTKTVGLPPAGGGT
jgi:hypothetical protein